MTSESGKIVEQITSLLTQLREEHERELSSLRSQLRQEQEANGDLKKGEKEDDDANPNGEALVATDGQKPRTKASVSFTVENFAESKDEAPSMGHNKSYASFRDSKSGEFHVQFELRAEWFKSQAGSSTFVDTIDRKMADKHAREMWNAVQEKDGGFAAGVKGRQSMVMRKLSLIKIIDPTSQKRVAWDVAGMVLIGYDMIAIPVHIAFQPDQETFTTLMGWVTLVFWTMDMGWSIFTGYYQDGQLVMQHSRIIKNYLKGWFWIDCIVVVPDWVMKFLGSVTNAAGLGRVLRIARIARVLRLLRLLKLQRLFNTVYDMLDSEATFIIFNLLKMLVMIIFMNHIVACAWYLIGRLTKESGAYEKNWLVDAGNTPVFDQNLAWKYTTSLHWSITQFTPASMDISARNWPERLFSIIILFWALVALSSIIGSVSAAMTALRNMAADENKQFWILRRYLRQNGISKTLSTRILRYLEYQQVQKHNKVAPGSVKLLGQLSKVFHAELQFELRCPFLRDHPLFHFMGESEELIYTLMRICHVAVSVVNTAADENLFTVGDEGRDMYFVKSGWFEYRMIDGTTLGMLLGPKLWAGEASLWVVWRHRGCLKATQPSECLAITPNVFREVFMIHPRPWYLAQNYGLAFVKYLNQIGVSSLTDVVFDEEYWTLVVKESDSFRLLGRAINEEEEADVPRRDITIAEL